MSFDDEYCPVCYENYNVSPMDGPDNWDDIGIKCKHYLCIECWKKLYNLGQQFCPICREDISDWLYYNTFYDSDEDDSDEDDSDEDDSDEDDSDDEEWSFEQRLEEALGIEKPFGLDNEKLKDIYHRLVRLGETDYSFNFENNLKIKIHTEEGFFILQIIDKDNKVIQTKSFNMNLILFKRELVSFFRCKKLGAF